MTPTHIRTLFLHPKPTYTIAEAAKLLGMTRRDVRGWMDSGELEPVDSSEGLVVPWAELVSFGLEFWSQEVVEQALGANLAEALPELLQLTDLEVRIPRLEVVTLERLAAVQGETISTVLARELRDLVSVHSQWLSQEIPGFAEALFWPESPFLASLEQCGEILLEAPRRTIRRDAVEESRLGMHVLRRDGLGACDRGTLTSRCEVPVARASRGD